MKYCDDYAALLDAYVDGELTAEEADRVRAHLAGCDSCRAYVETALVMRDAFPSAEDTPVPEGFAEGVMAAVRAQAAPRKRARRRWSRVLLPLAACCAVVLLVRELPLRQMFSQETASVTAESGMAGAGESASAGSDGTADAASGKTPQSARSEMPEAAPEEEAPEEAASAEEPALPESRPQMYTAETPGEGSDAPSVAEDTSDGDASDEDIWVENGNVVFSSTVYLTREYVGDALDGYEGKPYSNAMNPDEGVIGTGYAMTREELDHILYDVLDYPLGPMQNQARTTELCCIVVTEEEVSSTAP